MSKESEEKDRNKRIVPGKEPTISPQIYMRAVSTLTRSVDTAPYDYCSTKSRSSVLPCPQYTVCTPHNNAYTLEACFCP